MEVFMKYNYNVRSYVQKIKIKTTIALSSIALVLGVGGLSLAMSSLAGAIPAVSCSFAKLGNAWTLQADCSSSAQIDVPAGVTLDGGGYTISPSFAKTDNSNNAALGVLSDNVTIKNLTINGVNGIKLHGINVFEATGVVLNNVTLENNVRNGLVVNGSKVTVNNITTMNNGQGGIDVDKGSVSTPAVLTVIGTSTQTETAGFDIYIDNATSTYNSVIDTNSQYFVTYNVIRTGDAVYTLKSQAKAMCKDGGWETGLYARQDFKNQGACVSNVASNGKSQR
ncbi:hypothetical protein H7100_00830 [Candidatus Saccharibacteria bacterium]|nr:hypothetical protein [Candidatus Saccharibacteria bacterium]